MVNGSLNQQKPIAAQHIGKGRYIMKKIASNKLTALILPVITILSLALYVRMLTRPISYGMVYYSNTPVAGFEFESSTVFHRGNKMTVENSNFDGPQEYYYYYKDGRVFFCIAATEEEYLAEVEEINANWEEARSIPFYSAEINAYTCTDSSPEAVSTQVCRGAKICAIAFGLVEVCLAGLTAAAFIYRKKQRSNAA